MTAKNAVIFDLDGTLIDSHETHIQAFKNVLLKHGIPVSSDDIRPRFGKKGSEIILEVANDKGITDVSEEKAEMISDEKQKEYRRLATIIPLPGSVELIRKLYTIGIPMAIASAASRENVDLAVEKMGIGKFIKEITAADEVSHAKPSPEILLITSKKLGYSPEDCIVFDDSLNGVKAAKAAGMQCIAVSTGEWSKEELEREGCETFSNLKEAIPNLDHIIK